jgi:hypothetical protein
LGIAEFKRACGAPSKTARKVLKVRYRPCGAGNPARSRLSGGQSLLRPRLAAPQLGFIIIGDPQGHEDSFLSCAAVAYRREAN